jgi:hypothetical protein
MTKAHFLKKHQDLMKSQNLIFQVQDDDELIMTGKLVSNDRGVEEKTDNLLRMQIAGTREFAGKHLSKGEFEIEIL